MKRTGYETDGTAGGYLRYFMSVPPPLSPEKGAKYPPLPDAI
jgi:hypothetical protein